MYKDSYNQRLKEIRDKYGSTVKDTTSCLRTTDRPSSKIQSRYDDKYATNRRTYQNTSDKKLTENIDPSFSSYSTQQSSLILKDKHHDSFLYTQSKDERLKQIDKIRESFAQSRNKAVDDWSRQVEKSRNKYVQTQKQGGLRQRVNTNISSNPESFNISSNNTSGKQSYRNRTSSYTTAPTKPDLQLNRELKRNYDYNYQGLQTKQSKFIERNEVDLRTASTFRNNSIGKYDRQNIYSSVKKDLTYVPDRRIEKLTQSQTTSPIRGLMKFDSIQKPKRAQVSQNQYNLSKIASNTYDLGNIDKIQQRIQRILSKK